MRKLKEAPKLKPYVFARANGMSLYVFGRLSWDEVLHIRRCRASSFWKDIGGQLQQDASRVDSFAWFIGDDLTYYREFATLEDGQTYLMVLSL